MVVIDWSFVFAEEFKIDSYPGKLVEKMENLADLSMCGTPKTAQCQGKPEGSSESQ